MEGNAALSENTELVGVSRNIRRVRELIEQVAPTGFNVVVTGETGTGKELVVNSLYAKSPRFGKPFVKVNCAALPDTLLESEMFGYERGAFTGAIQNRRGKFEQANGGVLFLDEIGDMSLPLQAKLLHVLQGGDFTPLGSEKPVKTDVWVIAATNRDLDREVRRGNFRDDLYFRLSTVTIELRPLRERPEDIPVLIDYYIARYARTLPCRSSGCLSRETFAKLASYRWPGNVRELQNVLQRIIVLGEGEEFVDGMLTRPLPPEPGKGDGGAVASELIAEFIGGNGGKPELSAISLWEIRKKAIERVDRELISHVLLKTGWNRSKAARLLKISYKTMLQKIDELEIEPPPELA